MADDTKQLRLDGEPILPKIKVVDNLTTEEGYTALSANQGIILDGKKTDRRTELSTGTISTISNLKEENGANMTLLDVDGGNKTGISILDDPILKEERLTWQTVHSSIWDVAQKSLNICIQEDSDTTYTFYLNGDENGRNFTLSDKLLKNNLTEA